MMKWLSLLAAFALPLVAHAQPKQCRSYISQCEAEKAALQAEINRLSKPSIVATTQTRVTSVNVAVVVPIGTLPDGDVGFFADLGVISDLDWEIYVDAGQWSVRFLAPVVGQASGRLIVIATDGNIYEYPVVVTVN